MLELLQHLSKRCEVVGIDLVEVAPDYDPSGSTGFLAAQLLMNAIGFVFHEETGKMNRIERLQRGMARHGFAAYLATTKADIEYLTGFRTEFFASPTRPWFVVIPASGEPIAIIPAIGEPLMRRSGVADVRTWPSPRPDDEGVSLLRQILAEVADGGPVALPMAPGTTLGMALGDWLRLREAFDWQDDRGLLRDLRIRKDEAEIATIRTTCALAERAFARLPERIHAGLPLSETFRRFRILLHEEGADRVAYLAGAAGKGGYEDVISPATDEPLREGDVLMLDTGAVRDGYFSDFDRNFSIGPPSPEVREAHVRLVEATLAGAEAMRPGALACEVHAAIERVCGPSQGGRLGHGLGLQLTEPPSLSALDRTPLSPGMVLAIEPVVPLPNGRIMVHEENVVVRENGIEWLSGPPAPELAVIE